MKLKDKKINIYIERYLPNGNGYTAKVTEPLVLNGKCRLDCVNRNCQIE